MTDRPNQYNTGVAYKAVVTLVVLAFLVGALAGALLLNSLGSQGAPISSPQPSLTAAPPISSAAAMTPEPSAPLSTDCEAPRDFEFTIDLAGSTATPLSPVVQFRVGGLTRPAEARFFWGNDQYGVANLNEMGGSEYFKQVRPVYEKAGAYDFRAEITDHCGKVFTVDYPIAAPLAPIDSLTLPCPGKVDVNGFCLVLLGVPVTFAVAGGPEQGWHWDNDGPTGGRTFTRTFATPGEFWVQARALSDEGMLASPILKVAPLNAVP